MNAYKQIYYYNMIDGKVPEQKKCRTDDGHIEVIRSLTKHD